MDEHGTTTTTPELIVTDGTLRCPHCGFDGLTMSVTARVYTDGTFYVDRDGEVRLADMLDENIQGQWPTDDPDDITCGECLRYAYTRLPGKEWKRTGYDES